MELIQNHFLVRTIAIHYLIAGATNFGLIYTPIFALHQLTFVETSVQ